MDDLIDRLEPIAERVRANLDQKHAAREQALAACREVIRYSANAIRAVHRDEFEPAQALLVEARTALDQVEAVLADHEDVFHAGFVHNAAKEYAEGRITLALVAGEPLPTPEDLGVSFAAYLNGLGEAAGELRRHALDTLRRGQVERCEAFLEAMDDIYALLVTIDYPDAITAGLRRTTDMVRGVLERTRGDLTLAARQEGLERRLAAFEERLLKPQLPAGSPLATGEEAAGETRTASP